MIFNYINKNFTGRIGLKEVAMQEDNGVVREGDEVSNQFEIDIEGGVDDREELEQVVIIFSGFAHIFPVREYKGVSHSQYDKETS